MNGDSFFPNLFLIGMSPLSIAFLLSQKAKPGTVFENHRKSLIQHCERSELRLHLEWLKLIKNAKNCQFGEFLKN